MEEAISGVIEKISPPYQGGWRFASVPPHGTVVGALGDLQPGDHCIFKGGWKQHPKFGKQFEASLVEIEIPRDRKGIMDYLARHFKWIGPTIARNLVEEFGDDLFQVMEKEPGRLSSIQGITEARAREIHKEYLEIRNERELDIWFATHGITMGLRNKLVEKYGSKSEAVEAVKEDPYRLADDIWGVGFKKADQIALSMGIRRDSERRTNAGVRWVLESAAEGEGHCFLPEGELIMRCREILGSTVDRVKAAIETGIAAGKLVRRGEAVYTVPLHNAERSVAENLKRLAESHHEEMMREIGHETIAQMDADQQKALHLALNSKVSIITGGPGVGKTWTVNRIIEALGDRKIELAAPTGKAAKRMAEMSGRPARTIHRLLEFHPYNGFQRSRENPLECDTLILDETSMIDIRLMACLMDAVSTKSQVIFVGDVDQLPSVGPGRVLADLIESRAIPTAHLRTLHRQAAESFINVNAKLLNAGQKLKISKASGDFWFLPEEDAESIPDIIVKACRVIPKRFQCNMDDIQVLCPQKRGPVGAENLNRVLRPVLNEGSEKIPGTPFMAGDRVIQLRNNYSLEVFNGDIGKVAGTDSEHLQVVYDDLQGKRTVMYPLTGIDELQLAYALTVHKSQGSEFPVVIVPVHTTNYMMLKRNLLYTAITRGKKLVVLAGTMKAINVAIRTVDSTMRCSNLKQLMQ